MKIQFYSYLILISNFYFKMYRSAMKSDILDYITFVKNGVDQKRRTAQMIIKGKDNGNNNGGSFVKLGSEEAEKINKGKVMMKSMKIQFLK